MLVISESGKGGGRVLLAAVFFSVCASVVTTLWIHSAIDHQEDAARAPSPSRVIVPDVEKEREAETIAELKETVGRLQKKVEPPEAGIEILLAIEQGERQISIKDEVARLVRRGDEVVPEIVASLKSGRDQDWGGQYSFSGGVFRGYPRLRTALIDILRLIGTPAAKQGLLDALRQSASTADHRDLLMIYATTSDEMMIEGISAMVPAILEQSRKVEGKRKGLLERNLVSWSERQGVALDTDTLAELCSRDSSAMGHNRDALRLLLERDVERTYAVVAKLLGDDPKRLGLFGIYFRDAPRARIAAFYELVFERMELDKPTRTSIYHGLPQELSTRVEAGEARKEDARALLTWLKRRHEVEPDNVKRFVKAKIDALEKAVSG